MSETRTFGNPFPYGSQFAPPSVDRKTPRSLAARSVCLVESRGSIATLFTRPSGSGFEPAEPSAAAQLAPPSVLLAIRIALTPDDSEDTYSVLLSAHSTLAL